MDFRKTESLILERPRSGNVVGLRDTRTSEVFELVAERTRWMIGSDPACDLALDDPFVSRRHCLLERRASGTVMIKDQHSRNGTFLDGHPIEVSELRVGAYLAVGRTTMVAVASATGGERRRALEQMLTADPVLRKSVDQGVRAAQTDCSVLIVGETGTGKDLLARVVHEASRRKNGPFIAVNCGAIPRELIASELFGHERGSFTGASEATDGFFVAAQDGTLFLDELGELPIELQPNLLRALEQKKIRRVGGSYERTVDVRIVAATNRTEGLGTESGRLRVDLYHRLATVVLVLPPLRDRRGDVKLLVDGMLEELEAEYGHKRVTTEAWSALAAYGWPGNVRELRGAVARAVALGGDTLGPKDFFPDYGEPRRRHTTLGTPALPSPSPLLGEDGEVLLSAYENALRGQMEIALENHGSIRSAASAIGMPKSTFADRAKIWGLKPRRKVRFGLVPPRK
jgi:transcriptional regulator with PAS, ATPase and Fis domain